MLLTSVFYNSVQEACSFILEKSGRPSYQSGMPRRYQNQDKYTTKYASSAIVLCCMLAQQIVVS